MASGQVHAQQQGYGYGQQPNAPPPAQYGYGQQAVVQQPGHTTVVVNQQVAGPQGQKGWTQGLCGCFDDCGICLCVTFCGPCAACSLAQDMGEFLCLACCVPNWMTAARTKVRMQRGIVGSICDDCCVTTFCGVCAMCQLWREVKVGKQEGTM